MHVLSSCVFIHLSVSLSISLCDTNHLSACPQICPARARRTSMLWATRKQSCPFLFGDIATILLTATSGDTESYYTGTKNISEAKLFPFTVKEGKRKKEKKTGTWEEIADGLCYLCGCLYRGLGVLVSGEVRQNDLHGVVMSYRPALKAQAGRAATHRQRKWV